MGQVTDVPLLERGSPETNRGPAVANPRIRVCSTVVSAAAPCHARSSGGHLASERIGDEHPCPQLLNRDMRVVRGRHKIPSGWAPSAPVGRHRGPGQRVPYVGAAPLDTKAAKARPWSLLGTSCPPRVT